MQKGDRQDFEEAVNDHMKPEWHQWSILEAAEPLVVRFFESLRDKDPDQAEQDFQALEALNQKLRERNESKNFRRDDHVLPL